MFTRVSTTWVLALSSVKESSCAMGSGYLKNMFCVRYFSSMNPVEG